MSLFNTLIPSLTRTPAARTDSAAGNLGATVKPAYETKEAADAFAVTVYLPGVTKDGLELTADDGEFRVVGRRAWQQPAEWTSLYRESSLAPFALVLTHDNFIATDKIAAELRDGVLRVSLPKHEAVKPRKIAVS
jgi:HSP20 family protein